MFRHQLPLALIGPRACGKTTVAAKSGGRVWDTDKIIEDRHGSISSIVKSGGWGLFRNLEADVLKDALKSAESYLLDTVPLDDAKKEKCIWPAVISTGGGVVLLEENRAVLKERTVCVYLSVPGDILLKRRLRNPMDPKRPSLSAERKGRPDGQIAADEIFKADRSTKDIQVRTVRDELVEEITSMYAEREELYRECAHVVLDGASPMREILSRIADLRMRLRD